MRSGTKSSFFKLTGLFALALFVLFGLHQDFWLRDNSALVAGLPIGLVYHLVYCVLVSVVFGFFLSRPKR